MLLKELFIKMNRHKKDDAIIWQDRTYNYEWLLNAIHDWRDQLTEKGIKPGEIVEILGDYSPNTIALLLALVDMQCITVPISRQVQQQAELFKEIAQVETEIIIDENEKVSYRKYDRSTNHPMLLELKNKHLPGLILFSSGSTGQSKAAVHNWQSLLDRYKNSAAARRVIVFLLFDHIGGINTLLHTLSNGGCLIILKERTPQVVCETIAKHRAEVLPCSPTFLNLILFSHAYEKNDLSSLQLISYGTEVMPENILIKFHELFPNVRLLQTYGLSELGILRTKSKSSDSLFMKIEGDENHVRIRDGMLEIKTETAMLGYLNHASPFTQDGWFKTGDMVEVDGDYIHILGRASEIINVGGLKIFPAQVENVLEQMTNVQDVIVTGEASPITGHIVKAVITLSEPEPLAEFRKRMLKFCRGKLDSFAIPQKVVLVDKMVYGERFKKMHKIT